jgi:hypothetical protein
MNIQQFILTTLVLCMAAATSQAAVTISSTKIVSGTITTGADMVIINTPRFTDLGVITTGPSGPNWTDDSSDGFRLLSAARTGSTAQGTTRWEVDGRPSTESAVRFEAVAGSPPLVSFTFNLADSGINLPDGSVINAIYATWNTRGSSGALYTYTEGLATGTTTIGQISAPVNNLRLNWTDSLSVVQTSTFQRIFNTPITVGGGNGFTLNVGRTGNSTQIDAILLDVTLIPEPSTALLGGLGLLCLLCRRR